MTLKKTQEEKQNINQSTDTKKDLKLEQNCKIFCASALKLKTSVKKMALCLRYMKYKLGFAKFCQDKCNKNFKNIAFSDIMNSLKHLANIKKTAEFFVNLLENLENNISQKLDIASSDIQWHKYKLEITIGSGSYYKRFQPRARGRTYHIKKKLTHVFIKATEVK